MRKAVPTPTVAGCLGGLAPANAIRDSVMAAAGFFNYNRDGQRAGRRTF